MKLTTLINLFNIVALFVLYIILIFYGKDVISDEQIDKMTTFLNFTWISTITCNFVISAIKGVTGEIWQKWE